MFLPTVLIICLKAFKIDYSTNKDSKNIDYMWYKCQILIIFFQNTLGSSSKPVLHYLQAFQIYSTRISGHYCSPHSSSCGGLWEEVVVLMVGQWQFWQWLWQRSWQQSDSSCGSCHGSGGKGSGSSCGGSTGRGGDGSSSGGGGSGVGDCDSGAGGSSGILQWQQQRQ